MRRGTIDGIDLVTLVVDDQDQAIAFYVDVLGFELVQDGAYGDGTRWVEIGPAKSDTRITPKTPEMFEDGEEEHRRALIGASPTVTYRVDDCEAVYRRLRSSEVSFDDDPTAHPWGVSVTARNPSGNPVVLTALNN